MGKTRYKKELSCTAVSVSKKVKETPDRLCATKAEHKRIDNWLKKNYGKLYKKEYRKQIIDE